MARDQAVLEDAGPQTVADWAVGIIAGPPDEAGQSLTFEIIGNTNPDLFAAGPTLVAATGDLSFTPADDTNGSAVITVVLHDDGGTADGGDDTSNEHAFTITITPVNDLPTAADASITVVVGKSQAITLDYGDLETAQGNLAVTFGSLNGTLDTSALPSLLYTAPATAGDDSFTYTVTDRGDTDGCSEAPCSTPLSVAATVHVTVLPAPSGSISGVVFDDADANGTLDTGEGGLVDVVVQLQDANGDQLETFSTGADGVYTFSGLEAGTYQVYAVTNLDRVQTTPNPLTVTLETSDDQYTDINLGSVVSADLKVSMTYSVNSRRMVFTITVINDGPADALNATLTDTLPDTVAFVSVVTTQGTCAGGRTVNCNFDTIASGGSVTVMIQVNRINTRVAVVNSATIYTSIFDIDLTDNSATVTIP